MSICVTLHLSGIIMFISHFLLFFFLFFLSFLLFFLSSSLSSSSTSFSFSPEPFQLIIGTLQPLGKKTRVCSNEGPCLSEIGDDGKMGKRD